ncbi:MAG: hypothetical protein HN413_07980 [Chloroflexi bacterium]|jgi:hypothetical protein|nr:hypothetical protein [Chloroflexota bacterium]
MSVITGGKIIEGAYGMYYNAGAPTDGASGTYAGIAPVGALLIDTTNGNLYRNTGTQAAPAWNFAERKQVLSKEFNLDNGAGTTDDDLVLHSMQSVTPVAAQVVYTEASDSGDASGANVKVGSSQGGSDVVAATNLENGKAVGSVTALTLGSGVDDVGDNGSIWVRHTGVAATQVGKYKVLVEYILND